MADRITKHDNLVGMTVGSGRWPWAAAHPDCWGEPWVGTLLRQDDPRAWARTMAFHEAEPDQAAVTAHVAWCHAQGLLQDVMPVLYDFGAEGLQIRWDGVAGLRPAAEDRQAWVQARASAMLAEQHAADAGARPTA